MGDISAEPSMEDILSSIKRIIAEENDAPRARRPAARASARPEPFDTDEILELSNPAPAAHVGDEPETTVAEIAVPEPYPPRPVAAAVPARPVTPIAAPAAGPVAPPLAAPAEALLSAHTAQASRGPLDALSKLVVKPEIGGSDTLEGMVREMLRPMLREWLDAHLPSMVEGMVAREIERITGR